MEKCSRCGKEIVSGTYHSIHCSIVLKDDRTSYDWNCIKPVDSSLEKIKERVIDGFVTNSKVKTSFVYE